jgi:hypothetical protein
VEQGSSDLRSIRVSAVDVATTEDQNLAFIRHDHEGCRVFDTVNIRDLNPRMWGAKLGIEEQRFVGTIGDDDSAVDTTSGGPLHKGRGGRDISRVGSLNQDVGLASLEVVGGVSDRVVHAILVGCTERRGGEVADFVRRDPFAITHLCHRDHARTKGVVLERDIIDVVAPINEVLGVLVRELLAVVWVALVGVVDEDFAIKGVDEGFPDAGGAVCGCWMLAIHLAVSNNEVCILLGGPEDTTVETYSQV